MLLSGYHVPAGVSISLIHDVKVPRAHNQIVNYMITFNLVFQTAVKYPDYMTGYSASLFKDPDDFKPERWLNEGMGKIQPFAILPWGVGPRMCIGECLHSLI